MNISVWGLTNAEYTKGQLQCNLKFSVPWGGGIWTIPPKLLISASVPYRFKGEADM